MKPLPAPTAIPSDEELERCVALLRSVEQWPEDHPARHAIEQAAIQVQRGQKKRLRRQREKQRKQEDRSLVEGVFRAQTETLGVRSLSAPEPRTDSELRHPKHCYVCKQPFTRLHARYPLLCPPCADLNEAKREQRADLSGRSALITGGRTKVGFQLALKLLRDNARVLITTRFPRDAARRFAAEPDFADWADRLAVFGLDLRYLPGVKAFTEHLLATEPSLDILVNNAAQTLRPTPEQLDSLRAHEQAALLSPPASALLRGSTAFEAPTTGVGLLPVGASELLPLTQALAERPDGNLEDRGSENSWVLRLHEVPFVELLEVQLINAVAPFLLNAHLKPLLLRSPHADRHIVNVSAVEGQFSRKNKTVFHPHTNMAKAALNMMTRTSAEDYARDGIFMNSVDTGWLTNENPREKRLRMSEQGFITPLDVVDGAARVYDPVVQGVRGQPVHGLFLKDYRSAPW
ncbi:SDR family NAD(P)-dependent oxidoreductase [Corallococcus terminator]|uniref:SDR family oxidoreductase n=1 Tax=Corallococcus terminator TaxID=2316733 RepID=A0A3A8HQL4_9BACT|nr:SDR family oxidoreductase [Corallococcus terminator]RKG72806.1 SDR family oxidoreductase [Corallococcus terminator]